MTGMHRETVSNPHSASLGILARVLVGALKELSDDVIKRLFEFFDEFAICRHLSEEVLRVVTNHPKRELWIVCDHF